MKKPHPFFKSYFFCIFIIVLISIYNLSSAQVTQRDTLLTWRHFDYELDANNGIAWYSTSTIIEEVYPGIVLENEFVQLMILPEFGARIISFIYKPTGHEQFYTNPVGTPYGMGEGNFYYDWLMVFGGVFPTFPEPEHGKTWLLPWQWEFTEINDQRISLKMELQDTIHYPNHPGKFNNGITEVICTSTVTLERGKTSFVLEHNLQNTNSSDVIIEYWTCNTLAPGSVTGNTYTPANSEIIAPIEYVYLKDDWWSWMGNAETPAQDLGSHVFYYNNLAIYDNWEDMGIAYAFPEVEEGYYGVINHTNSEGIFKISDNPELTPGMKFWTWGAQQGLNADPENFYHTARPYIELWSGISTQFFEDASLDAFETLNWTETYLPTVSMDNISTVNENGALYLNTVAGADERFEFDIFMNEPDSLYNFRLELKGKVDINVYEGDFLAESSNSINFTTYLSDYDIPDGSYDLIAIVSKEQGNEVLSYTTPVIIPIPVNGISEYVISMPKVVRLNTHSYKLLFSTHTQRNIVVYNLNGQRVDQQIINGTEAQIRINTAGFYILHIFEENVVYPVKIKCW